MKAKSIRRLVLVGLCAGAIAPAEALALDLNQRVAIGAFRGPQAERLQDAVESALLRRYFLVPESMVADAARKSGIRLESEKDFAEVAKTLNVKAFVSATVRKQKNWRVEMVVRKGETGAAVGRYEWTDRRIETLAAAMSKTTPRRLQALLSENGGPAAADAEVSEAHPAPSLPENPPARPADAEAPADPGIRPYLEIGAGAKVFSRAMSYTDNASRLPGYRLDRGTAINMDMAFHPFALVPGAGWVGGIGLTGGVTYAVGIGTQLDGGDGRARTEVYGYEAGIRLRGTVGIVDIIPHVSYMVDNFVANVANISPDVRYRVARSGLGLRLALSSRAMVRASADYLYVLDAGPFTADGKFPRAQARGMDLSLGAGYSFTETLEAQVSVGLRRYGFDMRAQPGDAPLAGGAIDEYMSMTLGVAYRPALRRN
jgi:hypothetical protein